MIMFQCPECEKPYKVSSKLAGKRAKCHCGSRIAIPADDTISPRNELGASTDSALPSTCRKVTSDVRASMRGCSDTQNTKDGACLIDTMYRARVWIRLAAGASILLGIISVMTLFGIVVAWVPIWQAVLLYKAVHRIEKSYEQQSINVLEEGMSKITMYLAIHGILAFLFCFLLIISVLIRLASNAPQMFQ